MFQRRDQDVNYSLISAVRDGRLERARELINSYGLSYSKGWSEGYVLLCDAIMNNHAEVTKLLLTSGSRVNRKNNKKLSNTPLHFAVRNGDIEIVKMILDKGAIIDAKDEYGRTPLHIAIEDKNIKVTELLLKHRADVNVRNGYGSNPLQVAVMKGCIETVEALLQHDANINTTDDYKRTALHYTALNDSDFCWRYYPIELPYNNIREEIAKLLLSKGANVDALTKYGETALHFAVQNGYAKVVEALLEYNANVNSGVSSPLHLSAQIGHKEISLMLLNKGANVNAKQEDGTTALHIATQNGGEELVKVLLEFGADINSSNENGKTALHIASEQGDNEVVVTLLEYGADINITNSKNKTPLDHAINNCYYDPDDGFILCEVTVKTLICHIVKMKTANLYVSEKNLLSMRRRELSYFKDECEKEIASMKSEKINNLNISFYDILAKGTSSLAMYMQNENIVQVLKSGEYKTKFPIYATMIESNFRKGMERKELLEPGYKIFHFLFNNFPELPYDCIEKIFSYPSDTDLRILLDACKPLGICNSKTL